jgi:hypothetical protein
MIKLCASAALAFSWLLFADTAAAFLDPPYLTPEHPTASDTVSVNIHGGVCDAIGSRPGYPMISQNGNQIRIVLWSISYHDSGLCNLPIGTTTIAVGAYPAGSYTLEVDRDYLNGAADLVSENFANIAFTVGGAGGAPQPVAAPALGEGALALLLLGLIGIVWCDRRQYVSCRLTSAAALPMSIPVDVEQRPNNFSGLRGDTQ